MNTIYFYGLNSERYAFLSNFYPSPITIDNKLYPTVEHYFQSIKFIDEDYREQIRLAASPAEAKKMGNSRSKVIKHNWNEIRDEIMYIGLSFKFQLPTLRKQLLATKNNHLVENSPTDYYWGIGADNNGKNRLGFLLEEIRDNLK